MPDSSFIRSQWLVSLPCPTFDLKDQVYIVTGSKLRLGNEAARHFARLGAAKVILGVRNVKAGEEAKASIEASAKCAASVIKVWHLDLTDYKATKAFAKKVEGLDRVDAVVENTGLIAPEGKLAEGTEITITVNDYSTMLLAVLLVPILQMEDYPETQYLTSSLHKQTPFQRTSIS